MNANQTSVTFPRLCFVIGKGGVGKTTIAGSLALAQARAGKRVALVEIETQQYAALFGVPINYSGSVVAPHLTAIALTPRDAFREYVIRRLGSETLYKVFDNRFVHFFLDAIPGLSDLMCLGKLWQMCTQESWDAIVVDLPATGHGIGFLAVPHLITGVVQIGPLYTQARAMQAMLRDHALVGAVIVTLCEELPVQETIELAQAITAHDIGIHSIVANRIVPPPLPEDLRTQWQSLRATLQDPTLTALGHAADFFLEQFANQEEQLAVLRERFGAQLRQLPQCTTLTSLEKCAALAEQIRAWNGRNAARSKRVTR